MTNATRQRALQKLQAFEIQVGYPRKWRNYSGLHIDAGDLFGNAERLIAFEWAHSLSKLGHAVDRDEWAMPPQTVNAYNMPPMNMVVFPAAILQPPFFDPDADMAVNFGGIGVVIGHEMTHGFDDAGRQYDATGRLRDWWTDADALEFSRRSSQYGQQFAEFTSGIPRGHHINPNVTMGENIADLGGVTLALEAYRQYARNASAKSLKLPFTGSTSDGKEGDRRVLLAFAQALVQQLATDPHPPANARVNVPLCNLDAWYEAFNISSGNMTRPLADRVKIW
jgi:putative endopeptidase